MNDMLNPAAARTFSVNQLAPPEPLVFLHCAIFLNRNTILSAETFRLQSAEGQEAVSQPFTFQLELNGDSDGPNATTFSFDDLIGRPITVGIEVATSSASNPVAFQDAIQGSNASPGLSLFNGIITSFSLKNRGSYSITMQPALQRLNLTNSYRVFQNKTVWEMITTLLDAHNISYAPFTPNQHNLAVNRSQDWMQAGETDYDLLQRLLGKGRLYYYFTHTGSTHTMVFANHSHYPEVFADGRALRYDYTNTQELGLTQANVILDYSLKKTLASTGVHGVLTQQDGAWLNNSVVQFQSFHADNAADANPLPFHLYKSYQYGCSKDEARELTSVVKSTLDGSRNELSGTSTCPHFRTAHRFTLASGGAAATNPVQPSLENGAFVLTAITHQADADGSYQNQFQASDARFSIAPYSIQDTQQGSVLAEVVSAATAPVQNPVDFGAASSFDSGNGSFSDTYNQAPFPQIGVYVRFSTAPQGAPYVWVKLSSSMQTAPTIGSIVSVGRAQDESELPEIQNVVQSNGTTLVVPSGWLSNTRIGSNYSTSYGDNQSISYGKLSTPNLAQSSGIVSSAYNSGKFDDTSFSQTTSYSFSCADSVAAGAQSNQAELFGDAPPASDLLSASESFGSSYSRTIGDTSYSHSHINNEINNSWINDSNSTSYVGTSVSVSSGISSTSTSTLATSVSNTNVGVSTTLNITGQTFNTSINGDVIDISTTGDTVRTSSSGNLVETSISGDTVRSSVNGNLMEDSVTGNTFRNSVAGDTEETTVSGDTIRNSLTGDLLETSVTGAVERTITAGLTIEDRVGCGEVINLVNGAVEKSETQASVVVNITCGDSVKIETSGATNNIITMAETVTVETAGPGAKVSNNDETPHVDNIVTRICMIEALVIFM